MRTLATLIVSLLFAGSAFAMTIDFESDAIGTYSTLDYTDLTITYTGGNGQFDVTSASPGSPISDHALISYFSSGYDASPFRVDFKNHTSVTSFSIGVGDYNQDEDNTFLEAYDSLGNLLASDSYVNPGSTYGGDFLSVATVDIIDYVVFWDSNPFPGAVYWDDLTYGEHGPAPVPEPSTLVLFGAGLLGTAYLRRRKQMN